MTHLRFQNTNFPHISIISILMGLLTTLLFSNGLLAVVLTVQTKQIEHIDSYTSIYPVLGIIQPVQTAKLAFETQGKYKTINVDIGDIVNKGDLLATLDCADRNAQFQLAKSRTEQGKVRYQQALRDQRRTANLYKSGDLALQIKEQNDNVLEIAASELEVLKATEIVRKVQSDQCYLTAPWEGKITQRHGEIGQFSTPNQYSFELQGFELEIEAWLPMRFASLQTNIHMSANAKLTDSQKSIPISLASSSGVVDEQRLAVLTNWNIDTPISNVGKSVIIEIEQVNQAKGFWIDRAAVTDSVEGLLNILIVNSDNIVETYQVELIHIDLSRLYVSGPLADGVEYVTLGSQLLVDGQRVVTSPDN